MISKLISKFIPSLLYSIVFLGLFYWQFISVYSFIIDYFLKSKLFILYGYIFIYMFGAQIATITIINIFNNFLIKRLSFVAITISTILTFYILSFNDFYHVIEYFIKYPLPYDSVMGMVFFVILSFGYSIYSIIVLFFRDTIPSSHILIFLILGLVYSGGFIHYYLE